MKVTIDASRCDGNMYCVRYAPEVFDVDEFGYSRVKDTGDLSEAALSSAVAAEKVCPKQAIRLHEST